MRFWIEGEYKDHKSGGWGWQHTRMEDPHRAERLWLAMAVAMHMAVLVGGQEEAEEQEQQRRKQHHRQGKRRVGRPAKPWRRPRGREQSCLMRGQQAIQAAVIRGEEIPMRHVVAEAWPTQTYAVGKPARSWVKKWKEKEAKKRAHRHKQEKADQQGMLAKPERRREQAKEERERWKVEREEHRVQRQRGREERKRDKEEKRDRRLRVREECEQERLRRLRYHQEIACEREERHRRRQERMDRRMQAAQAICSTVSTIVADDEAFTSLPKLPETKTYP